MHFFSMTFRLGLLMAVVCIALSSCSKLFSPRGSGKIPDTDQTETLLKAHVFHLADSIGERNVYHPGSMERSARYIEQKLEGMGYAVTRQAVRIPPSGKFGAVKDWTAYNLIAIKKGTSPRPKTLIVGAHYDGTGTGDNGSGIALALTTAQKLFAVETEYTVVFVFFTAEELGLYGSEAYAQNMTQEEIDNTLYMINIDSVVCGDYCYLYGGVQDNENQTVTDTEAFDNAWAVAESLGLSFKKNPWTWGNLSPENYDDVTPDYASPSTGDWSDHVYFKDLGIKYLYMEATNWEIPDYTGYGETYLIGMLMNTENDYLEYIEKYFPGRPLEHLTQFSALLNALLTQTDLNF